MAFRLNDSSSTCLVLLNQFSCLDSQLHRDATLSVNCARKHLFCFAASCSFVDIYVEMIDPVFTMGLALTTEHLGNC